MPPALLPGFQDLLERHLERLSQRLAESELDAPALLGVLMEAAAYATERDLGLIEAMDVIALDAPASEPPGLRLVVPDRKRLERGLRKRLEAASRPPKEPGLLARIFGRGGNPGSLHANPAPGRRWRGMNDVTPPPETGWHETRNGSGGA
jgi:hypothetical protein